MRFSPETLRNGMPAELAACLEHTEFDRSRLFTQAAELLAPALAHYGAAPEGGWLAAAYRALTHGLFPDPSYAAPEMSTQQGLDALISALDTLLRSEAAPFDPLTDLLPYDCTLPTRIAAESTQFDKAISDAHFLLTLRIGRELMSFDAASHTIGVRNVVENKVDLTKSRNLIIAGVIFVCGLGFSSGLTFHVAGTSITLTGLAIAAIAGIGLNAILPGKDYEFSGKPNRADTASFGNLGEGELK